MRSVKTRIVARPKVMAELHTAKRSKSRSKTRSPEHETSPPPPHIPTDYQFSRMSMKSELLNKITPKFVRNPAAMGSRLEQSKRKRVLNTVARNSNVPRK